MTACPPLRPDLIERLAHEARKAVFAPANRTALILPEIEALLGDYLADTSDLPPLPPARIGFDRPTTLYVASAFYAAGGHGALLEQMVAARPQERHIVLFTSGDMLGQRAFSLKRMRRIGAFPIAPDPSLSLYDCHLWLRDKLASLAPQRVVLFHHPEDVAAVLAAEEIAPRFGPRLYVLRHSDTRPSLGARLTGATHVAIRPEQAERLRRECPGLRVHSLPLAHGTPALPAALFGTADPQAQAFTTATAGGSHKFTTEGPLAFGPLIAKVLNASQGRHIHIGPVSEALRDSALACLAEADIDPARLLFIGTVPSVATALRSHGVDLFLASFPIGGGLIVTEAACAGLPIAVHRAPDSDEAAYLSGAGHAPPLAFTWSAEDELLAFLSQSDRPARLAAMAASSRSWFDRRLAPARFARRLAALYARSEGRMRGRMADLARPLAQELLDPAHYLATQADVAAAGMDPLEHYIAHGAAELRSPSPLFDPGHYLAQLSPAERRLAQRNPAAHYALRGELRGLSPHPLFDPVLCAASAFGGPPAPQISTLGRYLSGAKGLRPHSFFDEDFYDTQRLRLAERPAPALVHFLEAGHLLRSAPHPLVDLSRTADPNPLALLLQELRGERPPSALPGLFDPEFFTKGLPHDRWSAAASNLLWAHLIEGNTAGHDPHPFLSLDHAARSDHGLWIRSETLIEAIATGRFTEDTSPLISTRHIHAQVPWLAAARLHPTVHYAQHGAAHNVDPHPCFSVQHYLYGNSDVLGAGKDPLQHYQEAGEAEGRRPHPFFDPAQYAQSAGCPREAALAHYLLEGAGRTALAPRPLDAGLREIRKETAARLLNLGDGPGAAEMLRSALHPEASAPHPTLRVTAHQVTHALPAQPLLEIAPGLNAMRLGRPAVRHEHHIAPAQGLMDCPPQQAVLLAEAVVVGGSDGVLLADGRWWDPGLDGFDPAQMRLKADGALVLHDAERGQGIIRRHERGERLPSAILGLGTYGHNYFHFLLEVLPRIMAAEAAAPPEVPILIEALLPRQHLQILRHLFPHRPIRRIGRGSACHVSQLYAGSMANRLHDLGDCEAAPLEALRLHPALLRRLAALGAAHRDPELPRRRLYFKRRTPVRRLLNSAEIEAALLERGFEIIECDQLSFIDQLRLAANAEVIVGQSGAHLANILFAQPGTRVLALYSNTPGTNYHLWDRIGQALDLEVINLAGWRIQYTNPPGTNRVHEDFTLPLAQLRPFLPPPAHAIPPRDLAATLTALYATAAEADALTGAWASLARPTPTEFTTRLIRLRALAGAQLAAAGEAELRGLLDRPFFTDFGATLRSGLAAQREVLPEEAELRQRALTRFDTFAANPLSFTLAQGEAEVERLLAAVMLWQPAYRAPLIADLGPLPPRLLKTYLHWLTQPPFLYLEGEDAAWADWVERLLLWFDARLDDSGDLGHQGLLYRAVNDLDLGQLLLVDVPLVAISAARNRLLNRFAPREPQGRTRLRPADGSEGRRRIGILCRSLERGPDSEAVLSHLQGFDRSRYEIFAYSVGFRDRVLRHDQHFAADLDHCIDHQRQLPASPEAMRAVIAADDLDVFLHANATSFGIRAQDLALHHRLAPVQIALNSHLPAAPGSGAFDAMVTGRSDLPELEPPQAEHVERLIRIEGPVTCYRAVAETRREPLFDRAMLGIGAEEVILMNAGSLSKLRHACLSAMIRVLAATPNSRLLLAPFNPGWVARAHAFAFNRQVAALCANLGVARERVVILGELSLAETESALDLCDIYLNPFPHGGATMTQLALSRGKPTVTLRRRSLRSIDQFLVASLKLTELLARDEAQYTAIAAGLVENRRQREALSARISAAVATAPFLDGSAHSKRFQRCIDELLQEMARTTGPAQTPPAAGRHAPAVEPPPPHHARASA